MSAKRHHPWEIERKLDHAEAELAEGATVVEVCKKLGISEQTYYRWRSHYRGHEPDSEAKDTPDRRLVTDNQRLKDLIVELVNQLYELDQIRFERKHHHEVDNR